MQLPQPPRCVIYKLLFTLQPRIPGGCGAWSQQPVTRGGGRGGGTGLLEAETTPVGGWRTGLGRMEKGLSRPRRWKAEEAEEAEEACWFPSFRCCLGKGGAFKTF